MVLGKGLVASGFKAYIDDMSTMIFASGVSNSSETDSAAFSKEANLLKKTMEEHREKTLVYFSTCSMYDPALRNSPYVNHKLAMERMVEQSGNPYHIFRISHLAGRTENPHTVLNFFVQHIRSGESFPLWKNASRNIIDLDDAVSICTHIIRQKILKNKIVDIANPADNPVIEIVQTIEDAVGKKANYELIEKSSNAVISIKDIEEIYTGLGIPFNQQYLARTIRKYYSQ